jgi:FkbM family methyltransferase
MNGSKDMFLQERIHIFPYPVSERKEQLYFHENEMNPGQGHVDSNPLANSIPVETVTLDGMVDALGWRNTDIDILKIDVEGAEVGVIFGAKQLLQSNRVQNIFMEGNIRSDGEKDNFQKITKLLVESGYVIHMIGGWDGPSSKDVPAVDDKFYSNLLDACGNGGKQTQCNIWWKVKHVL